MDDAEKAAAGGHFWPELLQSLWACAQSEAPDLREIALLILSEVPRVFEAQVERYVYTALAVPPASKLQSLSMPRHAPVTLALACRYGDADPPFRI